MQLRIADVKAQVEALEVEMNNKFTNLVEEVRSVLAQVNTNPQTFSASTVEVGTVLEDKIDELRNDLIGHIQVYNNHIIQQHSRK